MSTNNEQAIQDLTDQGMIDSLIRILRKFVDYKVTYDQLDVEIQSDMLFILTCVCENDLHRKVSQNQSIIQFLFLIGSIEKNKRLDPESDRDRFFVCVCVCALIQKHFLFKI